MLTGGMEGYQSGLLWALQTSGGFTEAVVFGLSPERLRSSQVSSIRRGDSVQRDRGMKSSEPAVRLAVAKGRAEEGRAASSAGAVQPQGGVSKGKPRSPSCLLGGEPCTGSRGGAGTLGPGLQPC